MSYVILGSDTDEGVSSYGSYVSRYFYILSKVLVNISEKFINIFWKYKFWKP